MVSFENQTLQPLMEKQGVRLQYFKHAAIEQMWEKKHIDNKDQTFYHTTAVVADNTHSNVSYSCNVRQKQPRSGKVITNY